MTFSMSRPEFIIKEIIPVGTMVPKVKGLRKCVVEYNPTYNTKDKRKSSILIFQDIQTKKWHVRTESEGPEGHTFRLVDIHLNGSKLTTLRSIAFKRPLRVYQVIEENASTRKKILKDLMERYPNKISS